MVTESTKKLRELLAFVLLGVVAALILVSLSLLFKDFGPGVEFSLKSALVQGDLVNPVYVLLLVAAVVMVTHLGEPTPQARTITIGAMAILGVMALLGLLTWISSLSVDDGSAGMGQLWGFGGLEGAEKVGGSFAMIVLLALIGAAIYFCLTTFQALPSTPKQNQQWGAQQPGQWGGQMPPQQGAWGGQPQQQWDSQPGAPQGQWGAQQPVQDQWGQPQPQQWDGESGAPQGSWGQPQEAPQHQWDGESQPPQQASWGQPQEAPREQPQWGQPQQWDGESGAPQGSWGQPQESVPGQWGQPQQPDPHQWGGHVPAEEQTTQAWSPAQDIDEESSWDRSGAASTDETSVFNPTADDADGTEESERDDRPGWWNPGR